MDDIARKHKKLLIKQEGFRKLPYLDTRGILTIGFGRNLKTNGISYKEGLILLDNDINDIEYCLSKYIAVYYKLDEVR